MQYQKKDRLGTYKINKISLSCSNDKRHILYGGISSLAYGYRDIW